MFKKGHEHKKIQVTFMKLKQKPAAEKPQNKNGELSPTTTLMHRSTLGESAVFKGRGMAEGLETAGNKGAQDGKTPLGLWQRKQPADDIIY